MGNCIMFYVHLFYIVNNILRTISIELDGEHGILHFLETRLREQGHAVIVVAEGAGEN